MSYQILTDKKIAFSVKQRIFCMDNEHVTLFMSKYHM